MDADFKLAYTRPKGGRRSTVFLQLQEELASQEARRGFGCPWCSVDRDFTFSLMSSAEAPT